MHRARMHSCPRLQTGFLLEDLSARPTSPTMRSSGLVASSRKPSLRARTT